MFNWKLAGSLKWLFLVNTTSCWKKMVVKPNPLSFSPKKESGLESLPATVQSNLLISCDVREQRQASTAEVHPHSKLLAGDKIICENHSAWNQFEISSGRDWTLLLQKKRCFSFLTLCLLFTDSFISLSDFSSLRNAWFDCDQTQSLVQRRVWITRLNLDNPELEGTSSADKYINSLELKWTIGRFEGWSVYCSMDSQV